METSPTAEDQQVGQRVAAQPVGAMHAARDLAGREESGYGGGRRVGVDADAAHHVVLGRADLHRLLGDVDTGQLLELVVHRGQALLDVVGRAPGADVEEDAAVRTATPGLDLGPDGPGHLVAGQQVGSAAVVPLVVVPAVGLGLVVGRLRFEELRDVAEHEALALVVLQRAAVAANALRDQDAGAPRAATPSRSGGTARTPCR